jgi:acyl dehydratase
LPAGTIDDLIAGLPVGASGRTEGRTITEGEFMVMHHLVGVASPLHANKQYAMTLPFGERAMGGGIVTALLASGWAKSDLHTRLVEDHGVHWRAAVGLEVRFQRPLQPNDTFYGVYTLESARPSGSRPGWALMRIGMRGENQRSETVITGTLNALFDRA